MPPSRTLPNGTHGQPVSPSAPAPPPALPCRSPPPAALTLACTHCPAVPSPSLLPYIPVVPCRTQVQYPDALPVMTGDLRNIRAAAFYLSKTELKFDLVSAVDELNKQIRLEFDFTR